MDPLPDEDNLSPIFMKRPAGSGRLLARTALLRWSGAR